MGKQSAVIPFTGKLLYLVHIFFMVIIGQIRDIVAFTGTLDREYLLLNYFPFSLIGFQIQQMPIVSPCIRNPLLHFLHDAILFPSQSLHLQRILPPH